VPEEMRDIGFALELSLDGGDVNGSLAGAHASRLKPRWT
jgi:hypothetical protein